MNLIGNCCISNSVARYCNEGNTNPFSWVDLDFESMFYCMTHWTTINWANIRMEEHKHPYWAGNIYWLIIDNNITIRYVHYLFDANAKKPTTIGSNVYYCRIWEYIINKYIERTKIMLSSAQDPTFVIEWGHLDYNSHNWTRLVNSNQPYKVVVITRGHKLSTTNQNILIINDNPDTFQYPNYYAAKWHKHIYDFAGGKHI